MTIWERIDDVSLRGDPRFIKRRDKKRVEIVLTKAQN
jgi:hypothetical protein